MQNSNNGMRQPTTPGNMNGAENGPLNLTGKQMGSPWAQLPTTNKPGQPGHVGHHLHPSHQSPQTMPLSPPLTPLPPNSARFPPSMVLPPQSSFNPAANLHQLLLAAQCNPFLKNPVPTMSPFMSPEVMENVQKILQLRQQQQQLLNPDLQKSDKESSDWVETDDENDTTNKPASVESSPLSSSNNNNNSNKSTFVERSSKSDEELKREEEMLEDEMKEEEDETSEEEKKQMDLADSLRAVFMKKFLEDFTNKSASGVKEMMANPLSLTNPLNQDGKLFQAGEIPCKYSCGKMFTSMMDLFQHQDGNCAKMLMLNCEDNEKDNVVTDDDMLSENGDQDSQDDLNTSGNNSSVGGERKVRVRTLISDEQLVVLRAFYMINPRPKREELEKVAAKIGHPFKVVKVWFQNSRARDRREGKPMSHQSSILGHPSPSQTHSSSAVNASGPAQSSFPAFPFLNNNFPQASNAALMTAAASLLQNTRGLPFINPNSPLFVGSNLEQPFDTTNKDKNDIIVDDGRPGSSEDGEKGGSTIEEGSDDEFQNSRTNDSPRLLNNHFEPRPSLITERRSSKHIGIEGERKKSILTSNTAQQPLDLSNKGLSSSSSSPSNSPLSASMKDTDDKEEKGEETEGEVILNLSSKERNGVSSLTSSSSSPITKTTHSSSIEDATVKQVEKITTSRPLSQQPISSIPSELPNNQPSPQSTGKSPFLNLSAQGSGFSTQTSSSLLGLYAKQSSNLPIDVYRFGGEEVCFDNDTSTTSAGKNGGGEKFDEEGNYSCEKCNKTFTKRSSLSRHKYEHSGREIFYI